MKKLLIVDDQVLYLKSLELALKHRFVIKTAMSYDESLGKLKDEKDDIEIALIDVRLDEDDDENIDGIKILEWIKANKPNIPVFMMSAYREFSYAEQALNSGAKHFFRKPIDVQNLLAVLEEKA